MKKIHVVTNSPIKPILFIVISDLIINVKRCSLPNGVDIEDVVIVAVDSSVHFSCCLFNQHKLLWIIIRLIYFMSL